MKIPDRLEGLLREGGNSFRGAVLKSVGDFETWLNDRRLVFFPEYTDHGSSHIERVLGGADWLLPEDAWASLGSSDGAVLVLATVLHDCAMHLSKDGFLRIIDRESSWPPEPGTRQPERRRGTEPSSPGVFDRIRLGFSRSTQHSR